MAYTMTSRVLMVITDDSSRALGDQLRQRYGWLAVTPERPLELLRQVMLHDTGLVVLVLGNEARRAVSLIERLRGHWRRVRVVAVSDRWNQQAETAVRRAGAAMCLRVEELEEVAEDLLPGRDVNDRKRAEERAAPRQDFQRMMKPTPL
jgi:DNA-binding response OmpR family regulator